MQAISDYSFIILLGMILTINLLINITIEHFLELINVLNHSILFTE